MAGWTNKGKYRMLGLLRGESLPANFYLALVTSATAPTADLNTFTELTEIAAGNGYTAGGISVALNSTDFDVWTEDDSNDRGLIQIKDQSWTASGGSIPGSGDGARYAVLTDANGTPSAREIWYYWDLASDRSVTVGNVLKLQDLEIRLNES